MQVQVQVRERAAGLARALLRLALPPLPVRALSHAEVPKTTLFPEPRATLNVLAAKLSEKPFEVYYKQSLIAPKSIKKKAKISINNEWTCTYVFQWPEHRKFESTALSKKQAAEICADAALRWLRTMGRIDDNGSPVYNKEHLKMLRESLNTPIVASVSADAEERMKQVLQMYEMEIKEIFANSRKSALQNDESITPLTLTKDSTIEDEDEFTEVGEDAQNCSELNRRVHPVYGRVTASPSVASLAIRDGALERTFREYEQHRTPLPMDDYSSCLTQALSSHRVVVLTGSAGCGKSTRAPVSVLRACGANATVLVSQPRRVAAVGLADRVATELGEKVGETVGYQVRLRSKLPRPPGGSILYCTSGVLLRRLQTNPGLEGCSHVFIDEAHERDINTDVILLMLKRSLDLNHNLKIIIMSATLDTAVYTRYFSDCPVLEVPGRTYPVEATYLEDFPQILEDLDMSRVRDAFENANARPQFDCTEVADVIKAVDRKESDGAILVFLPGWAEIKAVKTALEKEFEGSGTHYVLAVHSKLPTTEQVKMFSSPPPGVRKIILATNIAETSITVPDVTCVVDTGLYKENRMRRESGASSLETVWISRASAAQRAGRAGRVRPGRCYKLYTRQREDGFLEHSEPEIMRVPLEKTVLDCKSYAPDDKAEDFLSQLPQPPTDEAIQFAVNELVHLDCLSMPDQQLTSLGRLVAAFTLHPRLCVSLLHSVMLCNTCSVLDVVTQCAGDVEVFHNAVERKEEIRNIKSLFHRRSDHLALFAIQKEYNNGEDAERFCYKYGLRRERLNFLRELSKLHMAQLQDCGVHLTTQEQLNRYSEVDELTTAALLCGSDSLLVTRHVLNTKGKLRKGKDFFTSRGERAHVASDSVNYRLCKERPAAERDLLVHMGGVHSFERRALVVRKTSVVSPLAVILFARGDAVVKTVVDESGNEWKVITLPRHKLTIHTRCSQADLLISTRAVLRDTFKYFIERDPTNRGEDTDKALDFRDKLVNTVAKVLIEASSETKER